MVELKINRLCNYFFFFFNSMMHVSPFHALKQFYVNLLWSQMRQTLRAPVARLWLEAPAASHTPAASGRGTLPPPDVEPAPKAYGAGTVLPPLLPVSGKLRHGERRDLDSSEGSRRTLAIPSPGRPREALGQRVVDTALHTLGGLWH